MVDRLAVELGEFLEQLALPGREAARRFDGDAHKLIAAAVAMEIDDSLTLEPQYFARLRAGGDLEMHLAFEGRDFDLGAEGSLRETDRHLDNHVVVLAHEERMLLDVDDDVEVAGRAAAEAGLTLIAELEARAVIHPRRNLDRERLGFADASLALALRARVGDRLALAAALRTRGRYREKTLLRADLAGAATVGALARAGRAVLGARAVAPVAGRQALKLDRFFGAARRFLEFDFEIVTEVVAAARARSSAAAACEEIAEDVGEDFLEALAEIETTEAARSTLRSLEGGVTKSIVLRAPIRIGQNLVGLVDLLEALLGFLVAGIAIGMELDREATIGLLEFFVASSASYAKDFVIVTLLSGRHR